MSRIGKQPIAIPSGVEVSVEGNVLKFKKGAHLKELDTKGHVDVKVEDAHIVFSPKSDERQDRAYWGTYRALANNIVIGITKGFVRPINHEVPKGVEISVEKNIITIKGDDKQVVGQIAAQVRAYRPPEPYKGKGVKYVEERIIRKAGKTSKK